MTDIHLFSKTGELLVTEENMPDDPALRARFPALREAYEKSVAADAALESAKDTLATCVQQVASAAQYIKLHFPYRGEAGRVADVKAMIASTRRERFGV